MMMLIFAAALQAAAPQPGELRVFQDWTVGCDNVRACEAVSLRGEGDWEASLSIKVSRDAGPDADLVVLIPGEEGRGGSLAADGRRLLVRLIAAGGNLIANPADSAVLLDAFRTGRQLDLLDQSGQQLGRVSLAGLSAAMLHMDERQGRVDTVTALVRRGTRPASAVPTPHALPAVRLAPPFQDVAPSFDAARITALRRETACTIEEVGGPDDYDTIQIETGKTLILLACGTGAYNLSSVPLIAEQNGGEMRIRRAPFDFGEADGMLTNARWDGGRRLLTEFPQARGLGDCGTRAEYGWDGQRFRLVRQEAMGECRGAFDFITTWRARVVRP